VPVAKRDVAKAKQLLKDAGQPSLAFTLVVPPERDRQEASLILQAMWAEAGITANLQTQENVTMLQSGRKGDFEAYFTFWSGRPDPDGNVFTFATLQGRAERQPLLQRRRGRAADQGAPGGGAGRAQEALRQATEIMAQGRAAAASLWHRRVFTGLQQRVQGFTPYPDGIIRFGA
jgi:peptide/nickel transport system substrate-binding protein